MKSDCEVTLVNYCLYVSSAAELKECLRKWSRVPAAKAIPQTAK
jgi:hypothetical protein